MTSFESLMKLMFKSIPKKSDNIVVANVGNVVMQRDKWMFVVATPKVQVKVGSIYVDVMLDSRVEVNVITRSLANKARLTMQTNLILVLKTILGDIRKFDKAYKDINISISSITNTQTIIVIKNINHKLLVRYLFFHDA